MIAWPNIEGKEGGSHVLMRFRAAAAAAMLVGCRVATWVTRHVGRRPVQSFLLASEQVGPTTPVPIGLQEIPVARVVGSVGRWRELATDFRPRRPRWDKVDDERYQRIEAALRRGQTMPPIVTYLLDGDYYVLDGHHRVAAAKALDQVFIDAEVVEYQRTPQLVQLRYAGDQPTYAVTGGQDCLAA